MIVDAGKKALLDLAIAANQFKYIDIGDGGDNTSTSQTTLDRSILTSTSGVAIGDSTYKKEVSPTRVGKTLIYDITLTGAELASNVISEIGLFNHAGTMLSRVNFKPIGPLAASETISFTFRMELA
tara:strand:+ start:323 stop:700 length:378 start_codon:yes stop_codon:yes gene_type:complete